MKTRVADNLASAATVPSNLAPIALAPLHDLVTDRLRDLIVEGHILAGERINESDLCRSLGVSRTPIREALKVLASEGLVELSRNRGAVVPKPSREDARDMLLLMSALEAFAVEEATKNATEAEITELRALHNSMYAAFEATDRHAYFDINQRIHKEIVAISRNRTLLPIHSQLQARMRRLRFLGNDHPENWRVSVAEHDELIESLERRDANAASAAMRRHLRNAINRIDTVIHGIDGDHAKEAD